MYALRSDSEQTRHDSTLPLYYLSLIQSNWIKLMVTLSDRVFFLIHNSFSFKRLSAIESLEVVDNSECSDFE